MSSGTRATSSLADFISDLVVARDAIFGFGFAVALIVAFVYSYLMTLGLVDCVVWSCILITFAIFFGLGGYMYYTSKNRVTTPGRLELRKYDPIVRKHVLFKETK